MAQAAATIPKAQPGQISRAALARQAAASFVAVLACYWAYSLLAVPLIEPGLEDRARTSATQDQIEAARGDVTARQRDVAGYFSPGDWESNKPAIWKSGQVRLLFKTVEPNPDGTVALNPCTLLFFPKDGDPQAPKRPVIMRALEGATIRFDQPIELKSVDFGQRRFVGGTLAGPIRIYRQASAPHAGDDLEITTASDIEMAGERAWTDKPVNFRFGRSTGSGRDLEILLGPAAGQGQTDVMRGATLQTLKLNRDVQMQLEMGSGPLAGGAPAGPPPEAQPPIKITCQGPFVFEMETYAASFHDRVDVLRLNPDGASDQLNCALLTVYFSRPGAPQPDGNAPAAGAGNPSMASQVRLIEARGDPVTLRRAAQGMYARCHGIDFVPAAPGSTTAPGSLAAFGPGVIHGNLPDDPAGKFVAQWARELRFEPDGQLQKATLRGATVLNIGQMGSITADEVFAWLSRKPPGPENNPAAHPIAGADNAAAWQIEHVLAQRYKDPRYQSLGDVVIDSPQLHAVAARLEATIDRSNQQPQALPLAGNPRNPPRQPAAGRPPQDPSERFEVSGRRVHIQLLPQGEQLAIAAATIEHGAQLEQFATADAAKARSLLVKGDRLHVIDAHTQDTKVTIAGNPGYVEAGGMTLWGGAINLARRTNRLWIDGPGRMTMPISQDLDGQALPNPQRLTVDWKRAFAFQTATAAFEGEVVARSGPQVLNTDKLEAVLTGPIDFSNPRAATPGASNAGPELEEVRTHGPTFLESRQVDEQGRRTSVSQFKLADLSINRTTGKISGRGPGWIEHVARGAAPQILGPGQPAAAEQARAAAAAAQDQLTYLHVTFRQGLDGNLNRRRVRLFNRTRTVYGPVKNWNAKLKGNDTAALGPQGMVLEADALEVREMNPRPDSNRGWFELDGTGGVYAEGQRFTALGDRITYVEQKDQLVLRGTPGNPAEMYLENESGGPRNETRLDKVTYWFSRHYISVSGARDFNIELSGDRQRTNPQPK